MKLTKRIAALLVCVLMVAAMLPAGIFATTEETAENTTVKDYTIDLPFDDAPGYTETKEYFNSKKGDSGFTYTGSDVWNNYVMDETGNVYVSNTQAAGSGYSFTSVEGLTDRIFKLSFRMRLNFNTVSFADGYNMFPIVRISKDGQDSTGTGNLLGVSPKSTSSIGNFGYTTGTGTDGWTTFDYECVANTWYDIEVVYNSANSKGYVNISDGITSFSGEIKGYAMDQIQELLLFRAYGKVWMNVDLDDVRLTSVVPVDSFSDFNSLAFATTTDSETQETVTQKYPSKIPYLQGFSASGTIANWTLTEGEDGNKYLTLPGGSSASPLTWADVNYNSGITNSGVLNDGSFEVSYDFKYENGSGGSSQAGMFSVKTTMPASSGEIRIINMTSGGVLYFGPGQNLKIGTITTGENAEWHNIRIVMRPVGIEMLYEFYIDNELAAYTDIISGSYNFYTKASGSWVATNGIVGGTQNAETGAWSGTWGDNSANAPRTPVGRWDVTDNDGVMDEIKSIYMFHYNEGNFSLDNLSVKSVEDNEREKAELVGYQIGSDGASLRLVAGVSGLDFSKVGIDVDMFDTETPENGWVNKTGDSKTDTVYISLVADEETVPAVSFGTRYMAMLSIKNIDSSGILRVSPYTIQDGQRTYGTSVVYWIAYADGKITVTKANDTTVQNFDDGVVYAGSGNGFSADSYTSLRVNGLSADIRWGGDSANRSLTAADDGSARFTTNLYPKTTYTYTVTDPETGEEKEAAVTDADGIVIKKSAAYSARAKFGYVIPDELQVGQTLIITAKVKVTEISKRSALTQIVGIDGNTYDGYLDEVNTDPAATAKINFGFMNEADTNFKGTGTTYTLSVSDEWVELSNVLVVTQELLDSLETINDALGVARIYPLRPTIEFGEPGSFASEIYVDDLTCTVIPATVG